MSSDAQSIAVLFVDDEENIVRSIKRLFMDESFEILTSESGAAGLELLKGRPDVAVIVSDQRMPGMSGAEFLEQSRAVAPEAVRLVLTGYADVAAAVDAINKGGAWKYLAKPWEDAILLQVIREAAERFTLLRKNRQLTEIVNRQNEELKKWNTELEFYVQKQTLDIQKKSDELRISNERLHKSFHDSIRAFARLLELRDLPAMSHSRNVSEAVSHAARSMALPHEDMEHLTVAALLHDIGKIGIPDVVLIKTVDAMSAEELDQYIMHPVRGQAVVEGIDDLRTAGKLIRHHHEAYDGSGFPDRLRGDAIPLGARMIAVADFFDRAFEQQPGANAVDLAWYKVKQQEGKKFDPAVCKAMESAIRTVYAGIVPRIDMAEMELAVPNLSHGMTLSRDVRSGTGLLLLSKGAVLDADNIQALTRYHGLDPAKGGVYVWRKR